MSAICFKNIFVHDYGMDWGVSLFPHIWLSSSSNPICGNDFPHPLNWPFTIYSLLVFGNFPHCEAHSTQLKTLGKISWACSSLSVQLSSLQAALSLLVLCPANRDHAGHLNVLTLFTQLKETVGLYLIRFTCTAAQKFQKWDGKSHSLTFYCITIIDT